MKFRFILWPILTLALVLSLVFQQIAYVSANPGVFGYNVKGTSTNTISANNMLGTKFTTPADFGTFNSMSFYSKSSSGDRKCKLVIVDFATLTIIANGVSNEFTITTTEGWFTPTWAATPTLSPSTAYVLMAVPLTQVSYYYVVDASYPRYVDSTNSEAAPTDPTDATTTQNYKISIYIDYTEASAGTTPAFVPQITIY